MEIIQSIDIEQKIRNLPKADLHIHFEGSVTAPMLSNLAQNQGRSLFSPLRIGRKTIEIPDDFDFSGSNFTDFRNFAIRYLRTTDLIRSTDDVLAIGVDYLTRCQLENIIASELYFTPSTYELLGINLEPLFVGCRELEHLATQSFNHKLSWIFDIARNSPQPPEETVQHALKARELGVSVGAIGLAGDENCNQPHHYTSIFQKARSYGFKCIAHAGEGTTASHILDTIKHLSPHRIGHGISCLSDSHCLETLVRSQIPLEVCPWSNVSMGITQVDNHPLKKMIDANLDLVIASDDPGIFGKSLTDNYLLAFNLGVSLEVLERLALRSIELSLVNEEK